MPAVEQSAAQTPPVSNHPFHPSMLPPIPPSLPPLPPPNPSLLPNPSSHSLPIPSLAGPVRQRVATRARRRRPPAPPTRPPPARPCRRSRSRSRDRRRHSRSRSPRREKVQVERAPIYDIERVKPEDRAPLPMMPMSAPMMPGERSLAAAPPAACRPPAPAQPGRLPPLLQPGPRGLANVRAGRRSQAPAPVHALKGRAAIVARRLVTQ
jgi:hypothetical protein